MINLEAKTHREAYINSSGYPFSSMTWLSMHFDAARPEYIHMLNSTGIKQGWHVLDAGCGSGHFVESLSTLVGNTGRVRMIDLAFESITALKNHVQDLDIECGLDAQVGNILNLPYPDNTFDAVWCSAVTQYLDDNTLLVALTEFKRVVKPGGIIALKDFDGTAFYFAPSEPTLLWRSTFTMTHHQKYIWFTRPIQMHRWLDKLGLINVWQSMTLVERRPPLNNGEMKYLKTFFKIEEISWSQIELLPKEDQDLWKSLTSIDATEHILNSQEFYWREGHILAVGTVP